MQNTKILAIDDTESIRIFLRISLKAQGVEFYEAATAEAGLATCRNVQPQLVVLDLGLPDRDGLDILPEIKAAGEGGRSPVVVVLTVRKAAETKEKAMELGASAYVTKPFMMEDLLDVIQHELGANA